jgi:sodium/proline symporter
MFGVIDGGWGEIVDIANAEVDHFTDIMYDGGSPIGFIALVSLMAWGLGYFGMPHILVRYMAIRDPEEVKVARRVGTIWVIIALAAVAIIAMFAHAFIYQGHMGPLTNPENVIIDVINSGLFPSIIAGILFAAIMAAIMSTADSQLLVASSAVANDLSDRFSKERISESKLMWISRFAVVAIALIAMALALGENNSIMKLVSFAWAGFGSAFGATMIMSLFWKRINRQGAIAGIVVGALTAIIWNIFLYKGGALSVAFNLDLCIVDTGIYELLPGFIFSLIAIVVVSLLTAEPSEEMQKEFDEATEGKFY